MSDMNNHACQLVLKAWLDNPIYFGDPTSPCCLVVYGKKGFLIPGGDPDEMIGQSRCPGWKRDMWRGAPTISIILK